MDELIFEFDNFSGPLDLLLDVIKKRELDIHNLPMSVITNDFIQRSKSSPNINTEETAEFTAMATLLLKIKTEMLLPNKLSDPRENLVRELEEYERYKQNLNRIVELQEIEHKFFKRAKQEVIKKERKGSLTDVLNSYSAILKKKQLQERTSKLNELSQKLAESHFTITDRMSHLQLLLPPISVTNLFDEIDDLEEMVVTFSALLELIKIQFFEVELVENNVHLIHKITAYPEVKEDE